MQINLKDEKQSSIWSGFIRFILCNFDKSRVRMKMQDRTAKDRRRNTI